MREEILKCYEIEDNAEALACLKRVTRESKDECKPRLVLVVQENCTPCKEEKKHWEKEINEGTIEVISTGTERGFEIAARNNILGVPALVVLDCNDNIIEPPG